MKLLLHYDSLFVIFPTHPLNAKPTAGILVIVRNSWFVRLWPIGEIKMRFFHHRYPLYYPGLHSLPIFITYPRIQWSAVAKLWSGQSQTENPSKCPIPSLLANQRPRIHFFLRLDHFKSPEWQKSATKISEVCSILVLLLVVLLLLVRSILLNPLLSS